MLLHLLRNRKFNSVNRTNYLPILLCDIFHCFSLSFSLTFILGLRSHTLLKKNTKTDDIFQIKCGLHFRLIITVGEVYDKIKKIQVGKFFMHNTIIKLSDKRDKKYFLQMKMKIKEMKRLKRIKKDLKKITFIVLFWIVKN